MPSYTTYSDRIHLSSYQLFDWIGINLSCGLLWSLIMQVDQLKVLFWCVVCSVVSHNVSVVYLFNNFFREEFNFEKQSCSKKKISQGYTEYFVISKDHHYLNFGSARLINHHMDGTAGTKTVFKRQTILHLIQNIDQNYYSQY